MGVFHFVGGAIGTAPKWEELQDEQGNLLEEGWQLCLYVGGEYIEGEVLSELPVESLDGRPLGRLPCFMSFPCKPTDAQDPPHVHVVWVNKEGYLRLDHVYRDPARGERQTRERRYEALKLLPSFMDIEPQGDPSSSCQ